MSEKYIIAFSEEDRQKLDALGYEFCTEQKIGNINQYIYYNNSKTLTFSDDEKSRYEITNKFFICI